MWEVPVLHFFCFPRIAEIVVFKSRAYNFINNARLVQKIPPFPPTFYVAVAELFFELPARTLLRINSCRVLYCFPVQMCFFCVGISVRGSVFFSSCRRFPQTLFHIHKHVYEGLAPVLTSFELLHGTLPFLFKAPFFITLFLFPLIHDELPRGA